MELTLNNRHGVEISNLKYHSNDIIEFSLAIPEKLKRETWSNIEAALNDSSNKINKNLSHLLNRIGGGNNRDKLELMKLNFDHVYDSITYLTNGDEIITILKNEDKYDIGRHRFQGIFPAFFSGNPNVILYTLKSFEMQSLFSFDLTRKKAIDSLIGITYKIIPVLREGKEYELLYREIESTFYFTYGLKKMKRTSSYENKSVQSIMHEVIDWLKPDKIKCCLNCKFFNFSGISGSMSNGRAGYCKYPIEVDFTENITSILNWCDKFDEKNKTA